MPVQRIPPERVDEELAKADEVRDPPVPVTAWLLLDGQHWPGRLLGWANDPNGGNDGLRGLVHGVREYAPGFETEFLTWVRAEHIAQRGAPTDRPGS